jgi:sugar O-acyltransferase (sialic acid O-acetyltransferase NeuD family)
MKIVMAGYSGHAYVVAEAALLAGMPLEYYTNINEVLKNPFELSYLGNDENSDAAVWKGEYAFVLGVGDNNIRRKLAERILLNGKKIFCVSHPTASVSSMSVIGEGSFIARNASVNPFVVIGRFVILNTGSIVEHNCEIKDGAHIAPGAVIAGNVHIGENSFIGANSVVKQGVYIGDNAIIGAGAVVIRDVKDGTCIAGNPAKLIRDVR